MARDPVRAKRDVTDSSRVAFYTGGNAEAAIRSHRGFRVRDPRHRACRRYGAGPSPWRARRVHGRGVSRRPRGSERARERRRRPERGPLHLRRGDRDIDPIRQASARPALRGRRAAPVLGAARHGALRLPVPNRRKPGRGPTGARRPVSAPAAELTGALRRKNFRIVAAMKEDFRGGLTRAEHFVSCIPNARAGKAARRAGVRATDESFGRRWGERRERTNDD
jgi:hypothetical protein